MKTKNHWPKRTTTYLIPYILVPPPPTWDQLKKAKYVPPNHTGCPASNQPVSSGPMPGASN